MIVSGGPLTITVDYKIVGVNGNDITVELSAPDIPTASKIVTVRDASLIIQNSFVFGGNWTRK